MSSNTRGPQKRAGAVQVNASRDHDMEALGRIARNLKLLAEEHSVGDDFDAVEVSATNGTYDWKAYLRDELYEARRRNVSREKPSTKPMGAALRPPPSVFYA